MKWLLLFLVLLSACAVDEPLVDPIADPIADEPLVDPIIEDGVEYKDGKLVYNVWIEKPTPCYTVEVEEMVLESFPVQIVVNAKLIREEGFCATVISPELITGEMEIDHKPGSFTFQVNGETIFTSDLS